MRRSETQSTPLVAPLVDGGSVQGEPIRAVFDCMVFLQGAGRRTSPARRCLELVAAERVKLGLSDAVIAELNDVMSRVRVMMKFPNLHSRTAKDLLEAARRHAIHVPTPPPTIALPRDPKDQAYVDLAVAIDAAYLVTWNERHLTYLMYADEPEAVEFRTRYRTLKIVDPPTFLHAIQASGG